MQRHDNIDFNKFANLTEGYTIGHLLQFMDRATFYAHRNGILTLYQIPYNRNQIDFHKFE